MKNYRSLHISEETYLAHECRTLPYLSSIITITIMLRWVRQPSKMPVLNVFIPQHEFRPAKPAKDRQ